MTDHELYLYLSPYFILPLIIAIIKYRQSLRPLYFFVNFGLLTVYVIGLFAWDYMSTHNPDYIPGRFELTFKNQLFVWAIFLGIHFILMIASSFVLLILHSVIYFFVSRPPAEETE